MEELYSLYSSVFQADDDRVGGEDEDLRTGKDSEAAKAAMGKKVAADALKKSGSDADTEVVNEDNNLGGTTGAAGGKP